MRSGMRSLEDKRSETIIFFIKLSKLFFVSTIILTTLTGVSFAKEVLYPLWTKNLNAEIISIESGNDYFVVGTANKKIMVFSFDGNLLWSYDKFIGNPYYIAISRDDSLIAIGTIQQNPDDRRLDRARIYLLNRNGNLLFSIDPESDQDTQQIRGNILLSYDNKYILFGIWNEKPLAIDHHVIYLLDTSGNILWSYNVGLDIYDIDASSDFSHILIGSMKGAYLFNKTGKLLWKTDSGSSLEIYPVYKVKIGARTKIGILGSGSYIYFLNLEKPKVLSKYKIASTPAIIEISRNEQFIAVRLTNGEVLVFNKYGEVLWKTQIGGRADNVEFDPDNSLIYIYGNNGVIYAFETATGTIKWSYPTTEVGTSLSIKRDGSYLLASGGSNLYIFRPKTGNINIFSTPSDADVYIDNELIGKTPIQNYVIDAGKHTIKIAKEDYEDYTEMIEVNIGQTKTVQATLMPLFGYIQIQSLPDGANVFINGEYKGVTPLSIKLKTGEFTLRLEKEGYKTIQEVLRIDPGAELMINKELFPLPSPNTISTPTAQNTPISRSETPTPERRGDLREMGGLFNIGSLTIFLLIGGGSLILMLIILRKKLSSKQHTKVQNEKRSLHQGALIFPSELSQMYEPLEFIGEGGFARVFKAKRKSDGQVVALKIPKLDETTGKSFLREVSVWQTLNHTNIVKLYDANVYPIPYLEMEYVEGVNLDGKIVRDIERYPKPVDDEEAIKIIRGIAEGLKYAHSKGIVHRDLKPQNVLLSSDLAPKITDWGLAKLAVVSGMTFKGYSPLYAAPEQLDSLAYGEPDERTDIYLLGVILYELLTGKTPYEGYSLAEVTGKIVSPDVKPKSLQQYGLGKYDSVVMKCLEKRKEKRFSTVDEFLEALDMVEEKVRLINELKRSLDHQKESLKKSRSSEELIKNRRMVVELLGRLSVIYAELGQKAELLNCLEDLKFYTVKHADELMKAINMVEYMMKEGISVSGQFVDGLKNLVHRIERENSA